MAIIHLSWRDRQALEQLARRESNARRVRRAQAVLWLNAGQTVAEVAHRLGLSREAIYQIVGRFLARRHQPMAARVSDQVHPGRPATKRDQARDLIAEVLPDSPQAHGDRGRAWTAPLLRCHIQRRLGLRVSDWTVRRALHELRYRYKRPRYVLARRAPRWRQAKGG